MDRNPPGSLGCWLPLGCGAVVLCLWLLRGLLWWWGVR